MSPATARRFNKKRRTRGTGNKPFPSIPNITFDASPQRSALTKPSTSADKSFIDKLWPAVLSTLQQIRKEQKLGVNFKLTNLSDFRLSQWIFVLGFLHDVQGKFPDDVSGAQ
jgi:hypothetical protein